MGSGTDAVVLDLEDSALAKMLTHDTRFHGYGLRSPVTMSRWSWASTTWESACPAGKDWLARPGVRQA